MDSLAKHHLARSGIQLLWLPIVILSALKSAQSSRFLIAERKSNEQLNNQQSINLLNLCNQRDLHPVALLHGPQALQPSGCAALRSVHLCLRLDRVASQLATWPLALSVVGARPEAGHRLARAAAGVRAASELFGSALESRLRILRRVARVMQPSGRTSPRQPAATGAAVAALVGGVIGASSCGRVIGSSHSLP